MRTSTGSLTCAAAARAAASSRVSKTRTRPVFPAGASTFSSSSPPALTLAVTCSPRATSCLTSSSPMPRLAPAISQCDMNENSGFSHAAYSAAPSRRLPRTGGGGARLHRRVMRLFHAGDAGLDRRLHLLEGAHLDL